MSTESTTPPRRRTRAVVLLILTVVVIAAVAVWYALTQLDDGSPEPGGGATSAAPTPSASTPSTSPSGSPSATATAGTLTVAVYYATDTGTAIRMSREFRALPDAGGPAVTALEAMLAGRPLDPDYAGLWNPDTEVLGVTQGDGEITVDLSDDALTANVGSEAAQIAVQSLVYTVTAALQSSDPVRLLIEGAAVDELFGSVLVADPISRADPLSVRLLVQINDPNEGDEVPTTFTVQGEAAVFEANLLWRVENPAGTVLRNGFTTTEEGQRFAAFSFELTLEPGEYVVVIEEDDPSDGEGRAPMTDSRAITVG